MQGAAPLRASWERDVLAFGDEASLQGCLLQAAAPLGECSLHGLAHRIGHRADPGSVLGRERPDATEQPAQLALPAEDGGFDRIELLGRRR